MCELEDGTLLIASGTKEMHRWDITRGTVIRVPYSYLVEEMIELRPNLIVCIGAYRSPHLSVIMWKLPNGEYLRTLNYHLNKVAGLVKLKEGYFATAGGDQTIRVCDEHGNNIATYQTGFQIEKIALAKGSIVAGNRERIELRKP